MLGSWRVIVCAVVCALSSGCATGWRVTARQAPGAAAVMDEAVRNRQIFERLNGGCLIDSRGERVAQVVGRLTHGTWPGPSIEVSILRSTEANAYVLASGHVYVTAGMLDAACDVDELAAVLAHELAHLETPGAFRQTQRSARHALSVESDADERAVLLLLDAGYDPRALLEMINRLGDDQPAGWADFRSDRVEACLEEQGLAESFDAAPDYVSNMGE